MALPWGGTVPLGHSLVQFEGLHVSLWPGEREEGEILVIIDSPAEYFEVGRLAKRRDKLKETQKLVLSSSLVGIEGDARLLFDGVSMVVHDGTIVVESRPFNLWDRVIVNYYCVAGGPQAAASLDTVELLDAPAAWLLEYMRRSSIYYLFLALSGGLDSGCVALIVYRLCQMLVEQPNDVLTSWYGIDKTISAQALCNKIFLTCYLPNENYSSQKGQERSVSLAAAIGARHVIIPIGELTVKAMEPLTDVPSLAEQNLQARLRMVMSYLLAQSSGPMLVLSAANASEKYSPHRIFIV